MNIRPLRRAREIGAAALLTALLLTGCAVTAQPSPTALPTLPTVQATNLPATVVPTTAAPGTAVPPRPTLPPRATAAPPTVAPPTAVPPTARPGLAPLLGPEWRVLGQGDLYGVGVETVVAYLPSSVVARPNLQPPYIGYGVAAEQIVVVQRNQQGQPWVRLQVSLNGLFFNGDNRSQVTQTGVPDSRTIAFAVHRCHRRLHLQPADDRPAAAPAGHLEWSGGLPVER